MALEGLSRGIFRSLGLLKNKRKLDEEELREMTRSLRRALQEADFNIRQTKEIVDRLETRMREEEPRPGLTMQTHAMNILYTELVRILGPPTEFQPRGATLLLVGLYGQGKTTTTAKLAEWYRKKHGLRVAVIEADVHRPGAYAQLSQLLEDTSVQVYGEPENKDAVSIVRNGLQACASADLVIVDTAGRHQLDEELVEELERIAGLTRATDRWLVIDAQVGQAAGPVAASFHSLAGVRASSSPNLTVRPVAVVHFRLLPPPVHPSSTSVLVNAFRTLRSSNPTVSSLVCSAWATFRASSIWLPKTWTRKKPCA